MAVALNDSVLTDGIHGNAADRRPSDAARILVVEDSEAFRTLLKFTLEDEGYVVDCAESSEDAIRLLDRIDYDMVLSDYCLPGRSGAWLLSQVNARNRLLGIPCMIVTGEPDAPDIPERATVVSKSVEVDHLLLRIRDALANRVSQRRASVVPPTCAPGAIAESIPTSIP
jgi:two-component system phosphate regulon response regulator PhoB